MEDDYYKNLKVETRPFVKNEQKVEVAMVNRKGNIRPVLQYDPDFIRIIAEYPSMKQASIETGIGKATIHNHCRRKIVRRPKLYGFRYKD